MLQKIISGGQTGVDRGALDAAIEVGLPHGGYVPKGRKSEDGKVPVRYHLKETLSYDYKVRTSLNIKESDATLIFVGQKMSPGTRLTINECLRQGKDHRVVKDFDLFQIDSLVAWIKESGIRVLNVAGPRESKLPGAQALTKFYIFELLAKL